MQINPVSNNQTNFKGQLIFRDLLQKTENAVEYLPYLSLGAEHIESIKPFTKMIEAEVGRCSNMLDHFELCVNCETIIKTPSGDTFMVTVPYEEVSNAKSKVEYTPKQIEPGVVSV